MVVLPLLFLLGSLILCGRVEADPSTIDIMKAAALQYKGSLTCDKWDCDCAFNRQQGCCCGANDFFKVEDDTFARITRLWTDISALKDRVQDLSDGFKVAFKATMDSNITKDVGSNEFCFGPFNIDVSMPYTIVSLNDGLGYNPVLGVFTAPRAGVYVFAFTVYSSASSRLYHKVQLIWNGMPAAGTFEKNREDTEDSGSQVMVLQMQRGDHVYMQLESGRKLCGFLPHNIFTGYMLYPL